MLIMLSASLERVIITIIFIFTRSNNTNTITGNEGAEHLSKQYFH